VLCSALLCSALSIAPDRAEAQIFEDVDGDGYSPNESESSPPDCDDLNATVHPGAAELCDGLDNACSGNVPWDEVDLDSDGWMVCFGDCDDMHDTVHPYAISVCDGLDNDCNGDPDPPDEIYDYDGDQVPACADCDDSDPAVRPGAPEICDAKDSDCDTIVPTSESTDSDQDGAVQCMDCDDLEPDAYPGAPEVCDGLDNDCDRFAAADALGLGGTPDDIDNDGLANEVDPDIDGDGTGNQVDADDDGDGTQDGPDIDADGDGLPDDEEDLDGDGHLGCGGDCNDLDADIHPSGDPWAEVCDGKDNDCNGLIDYLWDFEGVSPLDSWSSGAFISALGTANPVAGVLEIIEDGEGAGPAPSTQAGAALFRPHVQHGLLPVSWDQPFCVGFDFRIIEEGGPADGLTVTLFDGDAHDGEDAEDDWGTAGGYDDAYLGAFGLDDSDQDPSPHGWAVEFDVTDNGGSFGYFGDVYGNESHVSLSRITTDPADPYVSRYRFLDGQIPSPIYGDLLAPTTDVPMSEQAVPGEDPSENAGWYTAYVGTGRWQLVGGTYQPSMANDPIQVALISPDGYQTSDETFDIVDDLDDGTGAVLVAITGSNYNADSTIEVDNVGLVCQPCPRVLFE